MKEVVKTESTKPKNQIEISNQRFCNNNIKHMTDSNRNSSDNWQVLYAQKRSNATLNRSIHSDSEDERRYNVTQPPITPMNDYKQGRVNVGQETTSISENEAIRNAELAYVVGRHDMKSNSQLQVKLRSSQDLVLRQSALTNSTSNANLIQKTPSSSMNTSGYQQRSSNSDVTVSTNVLFDSPNSHPAQQASNGGNSNNSKYTGNENMPNTQRSNKEQDMFVSYFKHHNVTKPLPMTDNQSQSKASLHTNNSKTISSKIQQASLQRKTVKGNQLNTNRLSVYPLPKTTEFQLSKAALENITKLHIFHNVSAKAVAMILLIPVVIPVLAVLPKSQFVKWVISKDSIILNCKLDSLAEDNPYSNYHINDLGYFGIVAMRIEEELKQNQRHSKEVARAKKAAADGEKHVGFSESPQYVTVSDDPIFVDIDYTRLMHYLDTSPESSRTDSEFLHVCLTQWKNFLLQMNVIMWFYFSIWLIASVICIVLVAVLT